MLFVKLYNFIVYDLLDYVVVLKSYSFKVGFDFCKGEKVAMDNIWRNMVVAIPGECFLWAQTAAKGMVTAGSSAVG